MVIDKRAAGKVAHFLFLPEVQAKRGASDLYTARNTPTRNTRLTSCVALKTSPKNPRRQLNRKCYCSGFGYTLPFIVQNMHTMLCYLTKYTITCNILYTITSKMLALMHDNVYNKDSSREQAIKEQEDLKMASVKIMTVETIEMDNVKVTYITGTEKIYPADKLPKTVAAWIEKNMAADDMEPEPATETATATEETMEPETLETIPEETPEPVNVPVVDVVANRTTGGLLWDITQYIVYPVAGFLLTVAAHGVKYLARLVFTLATFAGWMEPRYNRVAAMVRATASRIGMAAERAWNAVKEETPVILEAVKAYMVEAFEFRADIIAQDKAVDEF